MSEGYRFKITSPFPSTEPIFSGKKGTEEKTLPYSVVQAIKEINVFIVENLRTARRHIKKIEKEKDIDNTTFYCNGKHEKINLSYDMAESLYAALITDTGSFRYNSTIS